MVLPDQFLERPTLIPVKDETVLEGLYQKGERGAAVIAPPHPEYGGSMENPVVAEMVYGFYKAGYSTLRFNFKGVGASQGEITGDLDSGMEDYLSAANLQKENTGMSRLIGSGYSYGALITLLVYKKYGKLLFNKILLLSPPVKLFSMELESIKLPTLIIAGGEDQFGDISIFKKAEEENPEIKLEVIPEADHFYSKGLGIISKTIEKWLVEETKKE